MLSMVKKFGEIALCVVCAGLGVVATFVGGVGAIGTMYGSDKANDSSTTGEE